MAATAPQRVGTKHAHGAEAFAHENCHVVVLKCELDVEGRREGWKCLGVLLKVCTDHGVFIVKCPRCKQWVATRLRSAI